MENARLLARRIYKIYRFFVNLSFYIFPKNNPESIQRHWILTSQDILVNYWLDTRIYGQASLKKLINFYTPWDYQKTVGFLWVSEG